MKAGAVTTRTCTLCIKFYCSDALLVVSVPDCLHTVNSLVPRLHFWHVGSTLVRLVHFSRPIVDLGEAQQWTRAVGQHCGPSSCKPDIRRSNITSVKELLVASVTRSTRGCSYELHASRVVLLTLWYPAGILVPP